MKIFLLAGKPAQQNIRVTIPGLVTAYYTGVPDIAGPGQRVAFGTSGHRGSSFTNSFKENHIPVITQAICLYRKEQKVDGPLFPGFGTRALSESSFDLDVKSIQISAAN